MKSAQLLLVFAVAVAVRCLFAIPVFLNPERALVTICDAVRYDLLARNLFAGHGFSVSTAAPWLPDSRWSPGYPAFLAFWYLLVGARPLIIVVIQALLGGVGAVLAALIGQRIARDPRVGFWSGIIAGLAPSMLVLSPLLLTETLFTVLLLLSVLWILTPDRPWQVAAAGFVSGLATLCRPVGLFLILIYLVYLVFRRHKPVLIVLCVTAYLLVIGPWMHRNYLTFGRVSFATVADVNVCSYWAASLEADRQKIPMAVAQKQLDEEALRGLPNPAVDTLCTMRYHNALGAVGWRHILHDPVRYLRIHLVTTALNLVQPVQFAWVKSYFTGTLGSAHRGPGFQPLVSQGRLRAAVAFGLRDRLGGAPPGVLVFYAAALLFHIALLCFAVLATWRRNLPLAASLLIWSVAVYLALASGPAGGPRLRAPADSLLALLAAAFLVSVFRARHATR